MNFKREVARRVFAKELNNATYTIKIAGEKNPIYVLTPLGLRCNRVFVIGAMIEKYEVRPESGIWKIRVADPTGSLVGYVSNFQPEALESLLDIEPPVVVAITAKVKVFEGSSRKLVSLRPEMINLADFYARDYWIVETAKSTIKRIKDLETEATEDAKLAKKIYNPNLEDYKAAVREAITKLKEEYEAFEEFEEEEEDLDLEFEEEEFDLKDLV
ncbi:MAG: hypothetical protein QFX40_08445 [Archaeoglobales archaeon]|nr:hypothetical protein [Archaeoglobales archaeon]